MTTELTTNGALAAGATDAKATSTTSGADSFPPRLWNRYIFFHLPDDTDGRFDQNGLMESE